MHELDTVTILCTGLMVGSELAVSLFINPAAWRTNSHALVVDMAGTLGKVMPFWYGLCVVLLGAEAWVRRGEAGRWLLVAAVILWIGVIAVTVVALVPLNNKVAAGTRQAGTEWQMDHRRWDGMHRIRVGVLVVALVCFLLGVLR